MTEPQKKQYLQSDLGHWRTTEADEKFRVDFRSVEREMADLLAVLKLSLEDRYLEREFVVRPDGGKEGVLLEPLETALPADRVPRMAAKLEKLRALGFIECADGPIQRFRLARRFAYRLLRWTAYDV